MLKKESVKKYGMYLIPSFIVMVFLLCNFAYKGVYPFGGVGIEHYDLGQMTAAMYHHIYDVLHFQKDLFFDWYSGFGVNMTATVSIDSLLSPLNLFFYFIPRDMILQSLTIFTMLKLMFSAFTMFFFLKRKFKLSDIWNILFAVAFALNGYSLQYYSNSQWLEMVILFPLVIDAVIDLFKEGKQIYYTVVLSSILIINTVMGSMILIFLFFFSGWYLLLFVEKETRSKRVVSLGASTLISLGISAFIWIPTIMQLSISTRLGNSEGFFALYESIVTAYSPVMVEKWIMFLGTDLAIAIIIFLIVKNIAIKHSLKYIPLFLVVFLPIIIEGINLIWHLGSYVAFPMRFGYMLSFVLFYIAASLMAEYNDLDLNDKLNVKNVLMICTLLLVGGLVAIQGYQFLEVRLSEGRIYWYFHVFKFCFPILIVITLIILFITKRKLRIITITVLLFTQLFFQSVIFVKPLTNFFRGVTEEQSSDYIMESNAIKMDLDIETSFINRLKNIGNTLNANYPFVLERAALSNYTHTIESGRQYMFDNLGYSTHYTRLLDSGGTLFTDMLFHFTNTLSTMELDEQLYTLHSENNEYYYYDNKYVLPFGVVVDENLITDYRYGENVFASHEIMYQKLLPGDQLFEIISGKTNSSNVLIEEEQLNEGTKILRYQINVEGRKVIYFHSNYDHNIYVDGELHIIPTIGNLKNIDYPAMFNNEIIEIGYFEDEIVTIAVTTDVNTKAEEIIIALLELDKLDLLIEEYGQEEFICKVGNNSLYFEIVSGEEDKYLLLPLYFSDGWDIRNNEVKIESVEVFYGMMAIPLNAGMNSVSMKFVPPGLDTGLLISCICIILFIIYIWVYKKKQSLLNIGSLIWSLYFGIYLIITVIIYIIPMLVLLIT